MEISNSSTHPEMRTETVWMILNNEWYHIDNCKQYVRCIGILQHRLTLAHHHLYAHTITSIYMFQYVPLLLLLVLIILDACLHLANFSVLTPDVMLCNYWPLVVNFDILYFSTDGCIYKSLTYLLTPDLVRSPKVNYWELLQQGILQVWCSFSSIKLKASKHWKMEYAKYDSV